MTPEQEAEILAYAKAGNLIAAIKEYRTLTGVGLAEAKAAVEAMVAGAPVNLPFAPNQTAEKVSLERVRELLSKGKKIEAIKIYRETTGVSLKEAKDQVEQIARQSGGITEKTGVQKQGCFGLIVLCGGAIGLLLHRALAFL